MEWLALLLMFFARKQHSKGFTHFEKEGVRVFFYNENRGWHLFINGFATGLKGSGFLTFPKGTENIQVQCYQSGQLCFEANLLLADVNTYFAISNRPFQPVVIRKTL